MGLNPGGALAALTAGFALLADAVPVYADDDVFELREFSVADRIVAARFADLDGDGLDDLLVATLAGIPPTERRRLGVYWQRPGGGFPDLPSDRFDVPSDTAVFDVSDLDGEPGDELVFLRPDRVTLASFADRAASFRDLAVEGPATFAAAADERGFNRFKMVYDEYDEPLLFVPQFGAVTILGADGSEVARLETARRANYVVARPASLVTFESDIQLFADLPRLTLGDVDGDGRPDVISTTRHEIRVFRFDTASGFPSEPTLALPIGLVGEADHWRGSGSVATTARDVDRDGRVDLVISHIEGTLTNTRTSTYLFLNRGGSWQLDDPDTVLTSDKTLSSDRVLNLDRDDELELLRVQLKFTVLELVELLLQRSIDARVQVHELGPDGRFREEADSNRKISIGFSFETFRPSGFTPRGDVDIDGDGLMDFVSSANGDGIEIYLGSDGDAFRRRSARQSLPSTGRIEFGDVNDDGLDDFLLYNEQRPGEPLRLGINLGSLAANP